MSIGDNIKRFRKERGITQKKLGELCGIAEPNIRKYENGKQNPKLETIEKIASALGIDPFDLMGFDYWDQKMPDLGKRIQIEESFNTFLSSLGYTVEELPEEWTSEETVSVTYHIVGNGVDISLSQEEYDRLQSSSEDLVFSYVWKKHNAQKQK